MISDFKVKVLEKKQLTPYVIEVACETGGMEWEAGQYVSVDVNSKFKMQKAKLGEPQIPIIRRSYSLSTLPSSGKLGFVVDTKPMGPGSQYFINLKVGDEIEFKGPLGRFTLEGIDGLGELEGRENTIVFVATGTGIGPLRAMIDQLLNSKFKDQSSKIQLESQKLVKLYFGLRNEQDIFWQDWLEETKKNYPEIFNYQLVLSKPEAGWTGLTGHVAEYVIEGLEGLGGIGNFYLCGNLGMISDVSGKLKEKGVPEESIHFESYFNV